MQYSTKINNLFFSGNLTIENFKKYYEMWWDEDFPFSKRKKENPLWSVPYYNNNFKDDIDAINEIVDFLNKISTSESRLEHKPNSSSKVLSIDLFEENSNSRELEMFMHLESLDIINLDGIKVKKNNSSLSISDLSSGEYHLLISLIGMFSSIEQDSIVLIDEPEISLHPNWQMKYISFLKKVFKNFNDCQFIITTHSHFLVSDLEGASSSVIALKRDANTSKLRAELLENDTFGWSAEQVLLNVFDVPTTRNFYIADKLATIFKIASTTKTPDLNPYKDELMDWHKRLPDNDPLHYTIEQLIKRLGWLN